MALITQIHLSQNRLDLALKEVQAARKWAQDSLLVNIAESWVGLRVVRDSLFHSFCAPLALPATLIPTRSPFLHIKTPTNPSLLIQGGDSYQSAFYVFEELATSPDSTNGTRALISQAICEIHLGRLEEAKAALDEALKRNPDDKDAIANALVLSVVSGAGGSESEELRGRLQKVDREHALLVELEEKGKAFDAAAAKWKAKVAG